jgi:hypothetical protein
MRVVDMRGLLWCLSRGPLAALARSKLRARKRADHGIFRVLSTSFDVVARVVQGVDARLDSYVAQSGPRTATRHRRSHPQKLDDLFLEPRQRLTQGYDVNLNMCRR